MHVQDNFVDLRPPVGDGSGSEGFASCPKVDRSQAATFLKVAWVKGKRGAPARATRSIMNLKWIASASSRLKTRGARVTQPAPPPRCAPHAFLMPRVKTYFAFFCSFVYSNYFFQHHARTSLTRTCRNVCLPYLEKLEQWGLYWGFFSWIKCFEFYDGNQEEMRSFIKKKKTQNRFLIVLISNLSLVRLFFSRRRRSGPGGLPASAPRMHCGLFAC